MCCTTTAACLQSVMILTLKDYLIHVAHLKFSSVDVTASSHFHFGAVQGCQYCHSADLSIIRKSRRSFYPPPQMTDSSS